MKHICNLDMLDHKRKIKSNPCCHRTTNQEKQHAKKKSE